MNYMLHSAGKKALIKKGFINPFDQAESMVISFI